MHLKEVLLNILKNSIESIPNNGHIILKIKKGHSNLTVEITDNGEGISKENLPQIVEPFFSTKGRRTGSYGIGLTYVNSIMEAHNGTFDIYSDLNIGTTVILNFTNRGDKNRFRDLLFFWNRKYSSSSKKSN